MKNIDKTQIVQATVNALILCFLFTMALGLSACGGGSGGGSGSTQNGPGLTPDFTQREYTILVMGQAVMNQSVTIHMVCNDNAVSGMRDEISNLSLANNQVGGTGCDQVYNGAFAVTNNDMTYQLYFETQINGVTVDFGYIPAGQTYNYQHGYVIP